VLQERQICGLKNHIFDCTLVLIGQRKLAHSSLGNGLNFELVALMSSKLSLLISHSPKVGCPNILNFEGVCFWILHSSKMRSPNAPNFGDVGSIQIWIKCNSILPTQERWPHDSFGRSNHNWFFLFLKWLRTEVVRGKVKEKWNARFGAFLFRN